MLMAKCQLFKGLLHTVLKNKSVKSQVASVIFNFVRLIHQSIFKLGGGGACLPTSEQGGKEGS
jgi:hypothetical protein